MTLNVAYGPQIEAAARRHGLDPTLLAAVAAQETGGPGTHSGRNIVGDGGHGHGLFQIDDRYHPFADTAAAMNPAANAEYAAGMLASLAKQYGGDIHAALSAYNSGSGSASGTRTDWGDRTLGYADSVLRHYAQIQSGAGAQAASASGAAGQTAPATTPPDLSDLASLATRSGVPGAGGSAAASGWGALTAEQIVAPPDSPLHSVVLDSSNGAADPSSTSYAKLIAGTSE